MNHCERYRDELDDVAAGGTASDALRSHLMTCRQCTGELDRKRALLARIDGVARNLVDAQEPREFLEPVLARVEPNFKNREKGRAWWLAGIAAAAAVVALGFFEGVRHAQISAVPTSPSTPAVLQWRSPTAILMQPTDSVLDMRSRGRLLDTGGNHAL